MILRHTTMQLYERVMSLAAIPDWDRATTALAILPGGGHSVAPTRLTHPLWQSYTDDVWIAGTRGDPQYTQEEVRGHLLRNGKLPERIEMQHKIHARHTPDQVVWISSRLLTNPHIDHLILSTAQYHLARGALSFVVVWLMMKDKRRLRLSILPTRDPTPEEKAVSSQTSMTLDEEIGRIEKYQGQGDVATTEEFDEFLRDNH